MKKWRPLLTGPLADRAWQVVDEIAAVLAQEPATDEVLPGPSLAGGAAGGALFFAYRAQARAASLGDFEADSDRALAWLERSTDALASMPLPPDLYGGFTGVAWTAEHLYGPAFAAPAATDPEGESGAGDDGASIAGEHGASGAFIAGEHGVPTAAADDTDTAGGGASEDASGRDSDGDPLAEIDEALLHYLEHSPWQADYDLIRGLAGFGVYALERLPRPGAVACLSKIVERLAETAEHGPEGVTWHTSPELLPDWQRELYPKGYYNLGVAHGVPAVLALLGAAWNAASRLAAAGDPAASELAARARPLLDGGVRWLLAQRLPPGGATWFGSTFSAETPARPSRLAWCYGDPGIAAALLVAARAGGEPAWERLALDLALDAAGRPADGSQVRDAGLCHGSAGLAHLFNRIYQETGEPRLAEASRRWFERALDFRLPGEGLAGYRSFWVEPDSTTETWLPTPGFLEGIAGIGLAFLGGLSDFEPAWDRVLMLSAAPAPPSRQR
jgi:class I lanthipeptide synthase